MSISSSARRAPFGGADCFVVLMLPVSVPHQGSDTIGPIKRGFHYQLAAAGAPPAPGYDAAPGASNRLNARVVSTEVVARPSSSGARPRGGRHSDLAP